jgi:UDP-glucose 6-dehydrogenase
MKASKLVEAFVVTNSTPQMQIEHFLRNVNEPDKFLTDLTVAVFRLPKKERTFDQLHSELAQLFVKKLGLWGAISAIFTGLIDESGPMEGVQKAVAYKACIKMGYLAPD